MPRKWTPEQRQKQAERIRQAKPWEKSTGPRTKAGKNRARMNALKHGNRAAHLAFLREALRGNREFVRLVSQWAKADAEALKWMAALKARRERSDRKC